MRVHLSRIIPTKVSERSDASLATMPSNNLLLFFQGPFEQMWPFENSSDITTAPLGLSVDRKRQTKRAADAVFGTH